MLRRDDGEHRGVRSPRPSARRSARLAGHGAPRLQRLLLRLRFRPSPRARRERRFRAPAPPSVPRIGSSGRPSVTPPPPSVGDRLSPPIDTVSAASVVALADRLLALDDGAFFIAWVESLQLGRAGARRRPGGTPGARLPRDGASRPRAGARRLHLAVAVAEQRDADRPGAPRGGARVPVHRRGAARARRGGAAAGIARARPGAARIGLARAARRAPGERAARAPSGAAGAGARPRCGWRSTWPSGWKMGCSRVRAGACHLDICLFVSRIRARPANTTRRGAGSCAGAFARSDARAWQPGDRAVVGRSDSTTLGSTRSQAITIAADGAGGAGSTSPGARESIVPRDRGESSPGVAIRHADALRRARDGGDHGRPSDGGAAFARRSVGAPGRCRCACSCVCSWRNIAHGRLALAARAQSAQAMADQGRRAACRRSRPKAMRSTNKTT